MQARRLAGGLGSPFWWSRLLLRAEAEAWSGSSLAARLDDVRAPNATGLRAHIRQGCKRVPAGNPDACGAHSGRVLHRSSPVKTSEIAGELRDGW